MSLERVRKKVYIYKSVDDPKLIYAAKTVLCFERFLKKRYNGDNTKFTYDGEMMVLLKTYYIQVSTGVFKRIYLNEDKPERESVKLKKDWVFPNLTNIVSDNLEKVIVSWKHSEKITTDSGTSKVLKYPKLSYENDDIKYRKWWTDGQWLRQAVKDYIEHTNYDPKRIEETLVERRYKEGSIKDRLQKGEVV